MEYFWVGEMRFETRELAEEYCLSQGIPVSEIEAIIQIDPRTIPMR